MRSNFFGRLATGAAVALATVGAASAQNISLPAATGGTSLSANQVIQPLVTATSFLPGAGAPLNSSSASFNFDTTGTGGARISGTFYSAVYDLGNDSLGNPYRGFYYQVRLDSNSTTGVSLLSISGYDSAPIVDNGQFLTGGDLDGGNGLATINATGSTGNGTIDRVFRSAGNGNTLTLGNAAPFSFVNASQNSAVFFTVVRSAGVDPTGAVTLTGTGSVAGNLTGVVYTPVAGVGVVPEPGTVALLAAPMLGMVGVVARRRRAAK